MKKTAIVFILISLCFTPLVSAAKNAPNAPQGNAQFGSQMGNQGYSGQGQQQQSVSVPSATGYQVQNQNQTQTQNQGEDSQLQVNTKEQENLGAGGSESAQLRSASAAATKALQQVQLLQQIKTQGSLGDQVREIAQNQMQSQTQIQTQLEKLENRGQLLKLLIGADYQAINNLQRQMDQNQLRIQQLEQLQNQLVNQSDKTMVQEAIQLLLNQNTALQEKITQEEQSASLLGWLFSLFAK